MNKLLENNKTMWALSIVVALLLWMYVITDQNPKTSDYINEVSVEFTNIETLEEKGLVISNPQEHFINIRVYGRRNQLYKINKNAVRVEADLSRLNTKGSHFLPVSIYGIPDDVEITSKSPDVIEITLDQIVTQERNIKIEIQGNPAEGMSALSYISNPTKATIEGAEGILNSVSEVNATIDISNESTEISRRLPLKAVDINGNEVQGVSISPENVDVTIPIAPTKKVPIMPQINGKVSEDYLVTNVVTNPIDINIGGSSEKLNDIASISTENINVTGQTKSFEKKVKLLLPEGVEVINGEAAIIVKVTIQPYIEKTFQISNINTTNLKDNLEIEGQILEEPIAIILKGIGNQIEEFKEENISLYIDASNLQEGRHEVKINIELPEGIILNSITPNIATIYIKKKEEIVD